MQIKVTAINTSPVKMVGEVTLEARDVREALRIARTSHFAAAIYHASYTDEHGQSAGIAVGWDNRYIFD